MRSSNINEDEFVLNDDDVFVVDKAVNIGYLDDGDIIITAANGSPRLVGKHAIINGIACNSAVHGGFMLIAKTSNPHFLNASMYSSWYKKFVNKFVAGGNGAIGNLNKSDLDNQIILVPSEHEQKRIGLFFRCFDNLITLHLRYNITQRKTLTINNSVTLYTQEPSMELTPNLVQIRLVSDRMTKSMSLFSSSLMM